MGYLLDVDTYVWIFTSKTYLEFTSTIEDCLATTALLRSTEELDAHKDRIHNPDRRSLKVLHANVLMK